MNWTGLAVLFLSLLLLKAIFDPETEIYKCPNCNLTISQNNSKCPRCNQGISW